MPRPRPDLPTVELCLRLDEPTHRQLTAEAKRSVRSLQGEIIFRLRKSLDQPEGAARREPPSFNFPWAPGRKSPAALLREPG